MSSAVQETSSTSSTSNTQLIKKALEDYANKTGIDLEKENPFVAAIRSANSPEAVLELLQEREKAFRDYREGNRKLISFLSPVVNVIQAFSGILGDTVSLVSLTCHLVILLTQPRQAQSPHAIAAKASFNAIGVLLSVRPINTLLNQFHCDI